ncbi:MAG: type III polyketide synthase [Alphaproteobacteria bacterium]|nr:type III polyketide synthase [Alphaproteobacteria bacterium]
MTDPPRLRSLATAVPPHVIDQGDAARAAAAHFGRAFGAAARLEALFGNTQIARRHSCVPMAWYAEPHGFGERNALYLTHAVDLLCAAARSAIAAAGLAVTDIDGIVAVSSTGIATPSLDALVMERLAMRRDVQRLPMFGLGCAGGVIGLARTAQLARAEPGRHYLFLVVELCGLTFRNLDISKSNAVATALFGDGAAAAVISTAGHGPALLAAHEHTWADSLDIMGWTIGDDGFGVLFSSDIPTLVRDNMRAATMAFLERQRLDLDDIVTFVCHPGGAKVLDALEEVLGLPAGGLAEARWVLRRYGNMSAATVLFVLETALTKGRRGRHLLSSLGPGFTLAMLLLDTE